MEGKNKILMLGNEAIARGAYEAGVEVVAAYPGTPSTEISESLANYGDDVYVEWSTNEKVAVEVAMGASFMGVRAMACMKHVGFNVGADPAFTVSYMGVDGGLVFVVADDPGLYSSQNEQDTRMLALAAKLPVLEPSDSQEAKDFVKEAFHLSEAFDRPVILRTTTRLAHSRTLVELGEIEKPMPKPYETNPKKRVMMPGNARYRHGEIEKKNQELAEVANTLSINRTEYRSREIGVITSGIAYQYTREALPEASVLKLGLVHPLPQDLIRSFAKEVKTLYVVEELEPVIQQQVEAWGIPVQGKELLSRVGEYSTTLLKNRLLKEVCPAQREREVVARPPVLCPGCPHRSVYHVLKTLGLKVAGDIGCYTLGAVPPLSVVETTVCMGAGISNLHGIHKTLKSEEKKDWVAVIGDSTFLHSGIGGLLNMVYNQGSGTVLILDNSTTGMTGHQNHASTGKTLQGKETKVVDLGNLCKALGVDSVREVDSLDISAVRQVVREEVERAGVSVILAKSPCVLILKEKRLGYQVKEGVCRKCGSCRKSGCPAISKKEDGSAKIEESLCTGCGLCEKLCPFGVIERAREEAR